MIFFRKKFEQIDEFVSRDYCGIHEDMANKDYCLCCEKEIDSFVYPFCNKNCEDKYWGDIL